VKAVLILGANDGILPDYEEEAGIFSFGQKQELMRNMTSQPDESRIFSEKLSCYKVLTAPSRKSATIFEAGIVIETSRVIARNPSSRFTSGPAMSVRRRFQRFTL